MRMRIGWVIALGLLASVVHAQPGNPAAGSGSPPVVVIPDPTLPPPPPPPPLWSGTVEFGLNGASGNSELMKLRAGAAAENKTPNHIWKSDILYNYATANSVETENRALANTRYEWLLGVSPWSIFVDGSLEYDNFKAFDIRVASHAGIGYAFLKTDFTMLKGRLGAGASREIGGPENRIMPEALAGAEFEHKVTEGQKLTASFEFIPDLGEIGEYRYEAKAGYEFLVSPEWNVTLKLGVLDRYDSTPNGRKPNDIEYFAVLLWKY